MKVFAHSAVTPVLASWSSDGIAGDSLFWEHLHPTALGYYRLANAFVAEIVAGGLGPGKAQSTEPLPFDYDSLSICWLDLAYGEFSIRHLTGHWPFENYKRPTPLLDGGDDVLRKMVADVHGRKREWNEACYAMATYFWRVGRTRDALTTYEALLEEYPYGFYTNYLEGSLLNSLGRTEEALKFYRRSIASNPEYVRARLDLGLIMNRGDLTPPGAN
jgi:tetratricopeptide (TPR) repeat protein